MDINIHDKRKIHEIQKDFSLLFPNLKLEFFTVEGEERGGLRNKILVHPTKEIGECRQVHSKGTVAIKPDMTADSLKHGFKKHFGLHVKVYRKVGEDWLETIEDILPLEKHNASAHEENSESTLERI